jgi:hypothetical protein
MGSFSADKTTRSSTSTRQARAQRGVGFVRGMARTRGLGFDRNDSVFNTANSVISDAQDFLDSLSQTVPPGDRDTAQEVINTVDNLLGELVNLRSGLRTIARSGRYTSNQRSQAGQLISEIDSVSTKLQDEKERAQNFLNSTNEVGDPISVSEPTPVLQQL